MAAYHHGDLARALVEGARERIASQGVDGWSLSAVSKSLGVTHAAAYRHFSDKAALVQAVSDTVMHDFAVALDTAIDPCAPVEEQYLASGRAVVRFAIAHRRLYLLAFGEGRVNDLASLAASGPGTAAFVMRTAVERWRAEGYLVEGDAVEHTVVLWSAAHGLGTLLGTGRLALPDDEVDALCDRVFRALHEGLGPR